MIHRSIVDSVIAAHGLLACSCVLAIRARVGIQLPPLVFEETVHSSGDSICENQMSTRPFVDVTLPHCVVSDDQGGSAAR
jgi:hypothetical protein